MSVAFAPRGNRPQLSPAQIQKMLDENAHLIQTIQDYQAKGQLMECHQYQQVLHRNLVYLASIADANQNIQALLPVSFAVSIYICRQQFLDYSSLNKIYLVKQGRSFILHCDLKQRVLVLILNVVTYLLLNLVTFRNL